MDIVSLEVIATLNMKTTLPMLLPQRMMNNRRRTTKHELEKMNAKCEKVQCDLDQLMEHQAKQDLLNNEHLKNEIETIHNKHDLQIEKQTNIINDQSRSISELSIKIELLMKENKRLKQRRHYSCEECHFDCEIREKRASIN